MNQPVKQTGPSRPDLRWAALVGFAIGGGLAHGLGHIGVAVSLGALTVAVAVSLSFRALNE